MRVTLRLPAALLALLLGSHAYAQDGSFDLRDLIVAPPVLAIHEGAKVGDWLERTTETPRGLVTRQRTTIVASRDDAWVVEQTGPAWQGNVLVLKVDRKTKRVIEARAGLPEKPDDLRGVRIAPEGESRVERAEGEVEIATPAGTFRCKKMVSEQPSPFPVKTERTIALEGQLEGQSVKEVSRVRTGPDRWTETTVTVVSVSSATLEVSKRKVECQKIERRVSIDGVDQPTSTEWLARKPLFFGESLVKLESLSARSVLSQGEDGTSVFAKPESRPAK